MAVLKYDYIPQEKFSEFLTEHVHCALKQFVCHDEEKATDAEKKNAPEVEAMDTEDVPATEAQTEPTEAPNTDEKAEDAEPNATEEEKKAEEMNT